MNNKTFLTLAIGLITIFGVLQNTSIAFVQAQNAKEQKHDPTKVHIGYIRTPEVVRDARRKFLSPMESQRGQLDPPQKAIQQAEKKYGLSHLSDVPVRLGTGYHYPYTPQCVGEPLICSGPKTQDYSKRSCYFNIGYPGTDRFTYCDATRCTFENGQYCEHATHQCHDQDGTLIIDQDGNSVADYDRYIFVKWDLCLDGDGAPVPPPGEKPYDERIQAGCAYAVTKPDGYHMGYKNYMMTCDNYHCLFHPLGVVYNRETKTYFRSDEATKTPPDEYFPYLSWACLDSQKVNRFATKYRCSTFAEDGENWGCQVCFENGKHVYKDCIYKYDEKGQKIGTRVLLTAELKEQLENLAALRDSFMNRTQSDYSFAKRVGDMEIIFRKKPLSDSAREKVVVTFKQFFNGVDEQDLSGARLKKEFIKLEHTMRRIVKQ